MARKPSSSAKALTHADIRPVKERIEDQLLALPGVTGVDINDKVSDGKSTGKLAIVVYVAQKKPVSDLAPGHAIPSQIDGIPTDVKEERVELHAARYELVEEDAAALVDAAKYPTLHGGISMGPCRTIHMDPPDVPTSGDYSFVGTLGAIVSDRSTKAKMALTNFHVACVDKNWHAGDIMCQPGLNDGGSCPADNFGTLTRATLSDAVDGAVVTITGGKATSCTIEQIGDIKGKAAAAINTAVRKRGRTTGLTYGKITSIDASTTINYGDGLGSHTLKNQIRVEPDTSKNAGFSDHGDSGSMVVDSANNVVGLLFGGSTDSSGNPVATYANPINSVLDALGVDLCLASAPAPSPGPGPQPAPTPAPSPSPSPSPAPHPAPAPSPGPSPTPAPSPSPNPAPSAGSTGETSTSWMPPPYPPYPVQSPLLSPPPSYAPPIMPSPDGNAPSGAADHRRLGVLSLVGLVVLGAVGVFGLTEKP